MTGLAADPHCKAHLTGPQHPEQPARFDAAVGALRDLKLVPIPPRLADHDEIALCHSRTYIDLAEREILRGERELSTGDTIVSPDSLEAALRSTGGALNARAGTHATPRAVARADDCSRSEVPGSGCISCAGEGRRSGLLLTGRGPGPGCSGDAHSCGRARLRLERFPRLR